MSSPFMLFTVVFGGICSAIFYFSTCAKAYNPTCQYYLAPSSIPNAGLGIYTTQSIPANTLLQNWSDSPSIIITDEQVHYGKSVEWKLIDYFWFGDGYSADDTKEYIFTFGSLCNHHPYLDGADLKNELYRDDLISRDSGSPGVGASSVHEGWQFETTRDLLAGEEIFISYGENWLEGRYETFARTTPRKSDYIIAADVLQVVAQIDFGNNNGNDTILEESNVSDRYLNTIKDTVSLFNKRTSSVIPTTTKKYMETITFKKANKDKLRILSTADIATNLAYQTVIPRSLDWIRKEGNCLDNLISGTSTLPDAGRGGFAQRLLPKDSIVVPVPLLQIMYHDSLFMYDLKLDEITGKMKKDTSESSYPEPTSQQILINYCFSHPEIEIILCPQSNAALINHCSTRNNYGGDCEKYNKNKEVGKRGPNAKIKWTGEDGKKSWDPKTQEWLQMDLAQIRAKTAYYPKERGLSFDIVATRDILPGEEVFIDYGLEWEEAWVNHVQSWIPPSTESYIPISQLNSSITVLRTPKELETNPYPDNTQMVCIHTDELKRMMISSGDFIPDDGKWKFSNNYPCKVIDRQVSVDRRFIYAVEIYENQEINTNLSNEKKKSWTLNQYPREAILFIPKRYSSDEQLKGVFRHYITIKEEMIPVKWKDKHSDQCKMSSSC